jgi:hypothetical protein
MSTKHDGIAMTGQNNNRESIDHKTSRSICDAVGERLQQNLRPQFLGPAPELDRLLDEFRRRESGSQSPGLQGSRNGYLF